MMRHSEVTVLVLQQGHSRLWMQRQYVRIREVGFECDISGGDRAEGNVHEAQR